ncbi:hypothetical protein DL546_009059 [Coniochaeta pulveracea]|uniref:FAD-binding domain-containing protein n=1 Tax=Coniochaeta pulveracea TaxID=177199 RepID=A0A420YNR8_9PEZI|nr:hypothetical protein DL546_009059 [Coniochaeta pulveracea]
MDRSQWGKAANHFATHDDGTVTVYFDDGTSTEGSLLVSCEGRNSRIRRQLFPDHENYHIPVGCVGATMYATADEVEPLRQLDPFFLHGTASHNDAFAYFSLLEAPIHKNDEKDDTYTCQVIVSWPIREGRDSVFSSINTETNDGRISLLKRFALTWAEPFRSLVLNMPKLTKTTRITLSDWSPPCGLRTSGSVALVGDALHAMAMYRGEAVNHAIVDVVDFVELVLPVLTGEEGDGNLRTALNRYEDKVVERARPAVLASRQACLDAHNWEHAEGGSPLLSKRAMFDEFDEGSICD